MYSVLGVWFDLSFEANRKSNHLRRFTYHVSPSVQILGLHQTVEFSLKIGWLVVGVAEQRGHTNKSKIMTLAPTWATWSAQYCLQSSQWSCFKWRNGILTMCWGKTNELASSKARQNKIIWNELQVILKKFNVINKTIFLFESCDHQSPLEASLAENRTTFCNNLLYTGQQTLQQPIPVDFLGFFLNPHFQ